MWTTDTNLSQRNSISTSCIRGGESLRKTVKSSAASDQQSLHRAVRTEENIKQTSFSHPHNSSGWAVVCEQSHANKLPSACCEATRPFKSYKRTILSAEIITLQPFRPLHWAITHSLYTDLCPYVWYLDQYTSKLAFAHLLQCTYKKCSAACLHWFLLCPCFDVEVTR